MKLDARWKAAILSVAGTLAMMAAAPCVARTHLAEALSYVWRETDGRWLEALCRYLGLSKARGTGRLSFETSLDERGAVPNQVSGTGKKVRS
ncbi:MULTISPECIES: hypothetical protein [Azospirillum]|uniref:Uncharacterized protein n=1 Tax=Azospirillum brasilense TaxID=192 RepID=A0ABU4P3W7_AZOBR|nr:MULTISPECIES: hypothetical protein [Azospirillum]MDW7557798.1 hypothetical protein [Azospirillum brasilense]MDW7597432.1 hypothetical protein [Azospirillum brasilense]MDW7632695.1 hypothetical protein [Azospirillum brasilense]MDX5952438.1 hypothetical protein [Azospirillum brasilense]